MKLATGRRGDALTLRDRYTGNPHDLFAVGNQGKHVAKMSRDMSVDQDVLEPFWLRQPQWAHPVAGLALADRERRPDEVGVKVTDRVAGFEGRRVAGAGCHRQVRR